ncbi:PC4 and SFRS1-interacting protein-like isoform X2 [Pieris napi]|uniref:PC4 and SFRS1-interacting protein-like isoform X2 n=1 Tax=Pieris napi TaxID=78633 RepID=UPI001FB9DE3C|nr:PC4 and SFRS1-interacting protein-like isoform X2 [Pieris napi]
MKMGKKVREYKAGDFIFAKVKGYPAWPARVQRPNGKKYFVYFYGTAETANLPPNMIFDYAENKDKFLTKTVKRRDFNDGVKQIEYDFANNVPVEQVVGSSSNESTNNETHEDDSALETTADDTMADESTLNMTQNDTLADESDVGLVIDEVKTKGKKSIKSAKETPKKEVKTPKAKKNEEEEKKDEEVVSRSGRKIKPKRYIDEHTEENTALQAPAAKKKRAISPTPEKEGKNEPFKHYRVTLQSELEDLKEPFNYDVTDKENILIAYLPSGQYVGIKLFQSRPTNFKNEGARLKWDKQQAANAITMKLQLEHGQITPQSVAGQLIMELNLNDEEKELLDKERDLGDKKSRLHFLKTEVKMMELDAKIKTCLCLEKADTEMCLKLLDELMELDTKPLMLLKHPVCLETVKRMRAYVGNTASWDLSEAEAVLFSKHAHRIRKQADVIYNSMKKLFSPPEGLSFFEYFNERVDTFKQITSKMSQVDVMEMVLEPIEMSQPTSHTMKSAIQSANDITNLVDGQAKQTVKPKKIANILTKTPKKKNAKKQEQKPQVEKKKEENEYEAEKEEKSEKEDTIAEEESAKDEEEENKDLESMEKEDTNTDTSNDTMEAIKDIDKEMEKDTEEKVEKRKFSIESKSSLEEKEDEPKAKKTRESKKTELPPLKSPAKRKSNV